MFCAVDAVQSRDNPVLVHFVGDTVISREAKQLNKAGVLGAPSHSVWGEGLIPRSTHDVTRIVDAFRRVTVRQVPGVWKQSQFVVLPLGIRRLPKGAVTVDEVQRQDIAHHFTLFVYVANDGYVRPVRRIGKLDGLPCLPARNGVPKGRHISAGIVKESTGNLAKIIHGQGKTVGQIQRIQLVNLPGSSMHVELPYHWKLSPRFTAPTKTSNQSAQFVYDGRLATVERVVPDIRECS